MGLKEPPQFYEPSPSPPPPGRYFLPLDEFKQMVNGGRGGVGR